MEQFYQQIVRRAFLPLLFCLSTAVAFAQTTVTGRVQAADGSGPLVGVTVVLKGTTVGTSTDNTGSYSLSVPDANGTLVFSYIGFMSQEVPLAGKTAVNVQMAADAIALQETVVVGYGEQRREHVTNAVETITAKEIEDIPVGSLSQALVGRMAGVRVGEATGKPGSGNPLTIRRPTITGPVPDQVLYVIDGIIFDDGGQQFNILDASEVESISILKDGAAAIYGARGSGGVVLVKTKRGQKGKPKFNYSSSVGIGTPTQTPEMLTAREFGMLTNEILDQKHNKYRATPEEYERSRRSERRFYFTEDELAAMDTLNYNWLDGLYKDAVTVRHNLNISGGSDNIRYFVGGSYFKETGHVDALSYQRYSLRTNIEADITKDVVFSVGLSANRGSGSEPYFANETSPGTLRSTYTRLLTAPNWIPPTVNGLPVNTGDGSWNPYGLIGSNNYKSSTSNNTNINAALEYKVPFVKGLRVRAQGSYNDASGRGRQFSQDYDVYNFNRAGTNGHLLTDVLNSTSPRQTLANKEESLHENFDEKKFYQLNASLNYTRAFGNHNVDAFVMYEQAEEASSSFGVSKLGSIIKGYDYLWAFNNTGTGSRNQASETGRLSYIGRLNYNFKGKYLLETAFRYEASQKFDPRYAYGLFPSISAGWIVSEEVFFRNNVTFVDFFKLRASFGRVGNDATPQAFMWKVIYSPTAGALFGSGTPSLTTGLEGRNNAIRSPLLTWPKNDVYNAGIDLRFLNNRLGMSVDAFYRYSFDTFDRRNNRPSTLGAGNPPYENYGISYVKGLDYSLSYSDKIGNDFGYSIGGNFSYNYARPLQMIQNPAVLGRWDDRLLNDPSNQPGYIALGMIRTQEDLDRVSEMYTEINNQPLQLGMIYYEDIRGENFSDGPDGKIDSNDQTIIAQRTNAPYIYGFTLGASWKGLRISGTFSGAFGHKVFIQKDEMVLPTPGQISNVLAIWRDYWTPENPDASMPRPYQYGLQDQISTFWMRDGHTLRLNNINLSYELAPALLESLKLPNLRLYYTGTNILTIINPFDHKDPSVSRAYDYPMLRNHNLGINISF